MPVAGLRFRQTAFLMKLHGFAINVQERFFRRFLVRNGIHLESDSMYIINCKTFRFDVNQYEREGTGHKQKPIVSTKEKRSLLRRKVTFVIFGVPWRTHFELFPMNRVSLSPETCTSSKGERSSSGELDSPKICCLALHHIYR